MEKITNNDNPLTIVQHIQAIYESGAKIGSFDNLLLKSPESIRAVAVYLSCTDFQACVFSIIYYMNFLSHSVSLEDLASHLKCNPIDICIRRKEIDSLVSLKLVRKDLARDPHRKSVMKSVQYNIIPALIDPVLQNEPIPVRESRFDNLFLFLENIVELMVNRDAGVITFNDMESEIKSLITENEHLPYVQQLQLMNLQADASYILLYLCGRYIQGGEMVELPDMLKTIFPSLQSRVMNRSIFLMDMHSLQDLGLVQLEDSRFRSDKKISITQKCTELFFVGNELWLVKKQGKKEPGFIDHLTIPKKQLYFSWCEQQDLEFLEEMLHPVSHKRLIERLREKNVPSGIAILLHGAPGTGKTETVYQIARRTGRDIYQVDISEIKSMRYGESKKMIKNVFDKYRKMVEVKECTPILLLNEVDGIFSRRRESPTSTVDQTYQTKHAIQNIILQELEDLKGILIATTNMASSLYKAFEYRFLFDIQFEIPTIQSRQQIWKNKLPTLADKDISYISGNFDLSGGQIDNITRKYLMKEVIRDQPPSLDELINYCADEIILSESTRIGYKKD